MDPYDFMSYPNDLLEPDDDDVVWILIYDIEKNCFMDEMGFRVINPFYYISPNDLFLFKHHKKDMYLINRRGEFVELYYPEEEEDC